MITTKDMLEQMKTGDIFSCRVVKYDRKRKTGGQIIEVHQAVLAQSDKNKRDDLVPNQSYLVPERILTPFEQLQKKNKNPHHKKHYTRNIRLYVDGTPTEQILKVHPPLIIEFNGKQVL
jgi:hypothetical protein